MAKKNKPPFSNGLTEAQLVEYLKSQMPIFKGEDGVVHKSKYKWSDSDLDLRNQLIIYWITKNSYSRMEVVQRLMQEFGIARANAFEWSKMAIDTLNDGFDEYRDAARQMQIEKIEKCIQECRDSGRMKEAAMFSEQLNKIYGLYTDNKKIEVSSEAPIIVSFDK
jgi:hypothetical protein